VRGSRVSDRILENVDRKTADTETTDKKNGTVSELRNSRRLYVYTCICSAFRFLCVIYYAISSYTMKYTAGVRFDLKPRDVFFFFIDKSCVFAEESIIRVCRSYSRRIDPRRSRVLKRPERPGGETVIDAVSMTGFDNTEIYTYIYIYNVR